MQGRSKTFLITLFVFNVTSPAHNIHITMPTISCQKNAAVVQHNSSCLVASRHKSGFIFLFLYTSSVTVLDSSILEHEHMYKNIAVTRLGRWYLQRISWPASAKRLPLCVYGTRRSLRALCRKTKGEKIQKGSINPNITEMLSSRKNSIEAQGTHKELNTRNCRCCSYHVDQKKCASLT